MAEKVKLFEVEIDTNKTVKDIVDLQKKVAESKKEMAEAEDPAVRAKTKAAYQALSKELRALEREYANVIGIQGKQITSITDAKKALSVVSAEWSRAASIYGDNSDAAQKLAQEKLRLTELLKKEETATGDARRKVGSYTEALRETEKRLEILIYQKDIYQKQNKQESKEYKVLMSQINETNKEYDSLTEQIEKLNKTNEQLVTETQNVKEELSLLNGSLTDVFTNFQNISKQEGGVKAFFGSLVTGIGQATKAGLKFIATPIGLVITAVVVAIAAIKQAISQNQSLADSWGKAWAGVTTIFKKLAGILGNLGEELVNLGTKPKEALQDLLDFIVNNFKKRLEGFIVIWKALGTVMSGDVKKGIEDLANGFVQVGTGIENATGKLKDLSSELNDVIALGEILHKKQIELDEARIKSIETIAMLETKERELAIASSDTTKSLQEQQTANKELIKVQTQIADVKLGLAIKDMAVAQQQYNNQETLYGKVKRSDIEQLAEAKARLIQAQSDRNNVIQEGEKRKRELLEASLQIELDNLIDGFDQVKTTNEKTIANTRISLNERLKGFETLKKAGKESFDDQIKAIEKFAGISIDQNALINESDAKRINEQIQGLKISEALQGRLLEIFRERKAALRDYNDLDLQLSEEQIQRTIDQNVLANAVYENSRSSKLATQKKYNNKQLFEDLKTFGKMQENEKKSIELQYENGLITKEQYQIQIEELNQKYFDRALSATEADTQRQNEVAQTNYDNKLAIFQDNEFAQLDIIKERLKEEERLEIESAEEIGADTSLIKAKYEKQQLALEKQKNALILDGTQNLLKATGKLMEEGSETAKAFAAMDTAINTYKAAMAAYSSLAGITGVGPILGALAAAAVTTQGLMTVKKIYQTTPENAGSGGGGGGGVASVNPNQGIDPSSIVSRDFQPETEGAGVVPVLVVDDVTMNQEKQAQKTQISTL